MTLGQLIRAHRLRWGRLPHAEGFMRLTSLPFDRYRAEFCPLGQLPNDRRTGDTEYVIWWDKDHGMSLINESSFLRSLRKIKQPFRVVLNGAGELVNAGDPERRGG